LDATQTPAEDTQPARRQALEEHARFYARIGAAIIFTDGIEGEAAKASRRKKWQTTEPLTDPDYAAGLIGARGLVANIGINLRTSNQVGIELDGQQEIDRARELGLPETLTARSSSPDRLHLHYRPPAGLDELEYVSFRFEHEKVIAARNNYYVSPPSIHPDGPVYTFTSELVEPAELPLGVYLELVSLAKSSRSVASVAGRGSLPEGSRDVGLTSHAGKLRRIGCSPAELLAALHVRNEEECKPPLSARDVERIARSVGGYPSGVSDPDGPQPLQSIRADEIQPRSIKWLDKPKLQRSAFHLITGVKGCGKGTWTARTAAGMTTGAYGSPQNVVIVTTEDSTSIDTVPRLIAAGADLSRVYFIEEHFVLPRDIQRLEDSVSEIGDVGMLIIDPIGNHMGGADTDRESAVRYAISDLNRMADELDCAIIGIRHLGKNRMGGALASVLGSTAWVDLPRAVLAFAKDDEDEMVFHVQVIAGNRSGHGAGEAYRIELRDVGLEEPVTYAAHIGTSTKDVDDLLTADRTTPKSKDARGLLLDILDTEGEQESDALDARVARETGLAARTIRNLRSELKAAGLIRAVAQRNDDGSVGRWIVARTAAPRT